MCLCKGQVEGGHQMSLGVEGVWSGEERALIKRLKCLDGERVCSFNRTLRIILQLKTVVDLMTRCGTSHAP